MILGPLPPLPTLVRREAERAVLRQVLSAHTSGVGGIVGIEGSAGMGKTSLLCEHAHAAAASGVRVVWARATQIDQMRPFGCLVEALDCRLLHPDPARRRVAEAMVAVVDAAIDPFRIDSDASWRFPVQEAICDVVLAMADSGATLLAVDDIQWADAGTQGVVLALARRCRSVPLGIAWTLRSGHSADPIDQILGRFPEYVTQLSLAPLTPGDAKELGRSVAGGSLSREALDRVERAAGNPFFIAALAAHGGSDATLANVVEQWVGRLPRGTSDLLGVAAILGAEVDIGVLSAMTDRPVGDLAASLEPAVGSGLLRRFDPRRFAFSHELIRSWFDDSLPSSLRMALHRDAARVHADRGGDPGVIAQHLAWGARFGDDDAARQIRNACIQVVRHDSNSAADLLGAAAALCAPGSQMWAEATADRVVALQWAGRARDAVELAEEAVTHPMPKQSETLMRMARAASLGLVNDLQGSAAQYRALADDDGVEPALRAQALADLATLEAWGVDRPAGREHAHEAITIARECAALQAELQGLCALSTMALFDGDVRTAIDTAREAVTAGRTMTAGTPARKLYLAMALENADQPDEAEIWLRSGQDAAEAIVDHWLVSRYQLARLTAALNTGAWDVAASEARAIVDLHVRSGIASGTPQAPAVAAIVAVRRLESPDAWAADEQLARATATPGAEPAGLLYLGWLDALLAERRGDLDAGIATLRFLNDVLGVSAPLIGLWIAPDLVRLLIAAGDLEGAEGVARSIIPVAERLGVASARGTRLLVDGLCLAARHDERAAGTLRDAHSLLDASGRLPLALVAVEDLAAIEGEAAWGSVVRVLRSRLGIRAAEVGMSGRPAGGRSLAGGTGLEVPTSGRHARLTPTEQRVAALIADGLTNADIAVTLELSKRTVEFHVSHLYAKLGVTTRTAIAARVREGSH